VSKNKGYNSIFFITTLSVYLGLVLVGASPSILAQQAALTQRFEVQNEVDFEEDLDKKPDENDLFSSSIVKFVQGLDKFSKAGIFDWQAKKEIKIESFAFCQSDNLPSYLGTGSINRQVDKLIKEIAVEIARNLLTKKSELKLGDFYDRNLDYQFTFDNDSLSIQTKIGFETERDAQIFSDEINNYISRIISFSKPATEQIIAHNTELKYENNQVFIVTRLPRGSLDALVASEKQGY
jgi:hypothetical protein